MCRNCHGPIVLLLLSLLIPTFPLAGSQTEGWSSEELTLAKQLGLDLNVKYTCFGMLPIGEQTWLSPWVAEGTVGRIETDPDDFYHTKVHFHVERWFKGKADSEIILSFMYGPVYSEKHGMLEAHEKPGVEFISEDIGKRFILFMNKDRMIRPGEGVIHPRGANEFSVRNRFVITGNTALPDRKLNPTANAYPHGKIVEEILRVAVPQSHLPGDMSS
jgi:hypothetical protein